MTVTYVLAIHKSKLYVAVKPGAASKASLERDDPSTWRARNDCVPPGKVNFANLYSESSRSDHRFQYRQGEKPANYYEKYSNPLDVVTDEDDGMNVIHRGFKARLSRRELDTCEVLRKYPHHNIAAYHGVECATKLTYMPHDKMMEARFDTERVTKLIFTRYDHNLWDLATRSQMVRVDVVQCLSSIEAGIRRLHSLGIVHCDIKLDNLFVKRMVSQGNRVYFLYVVGDFDSCHRVDERLRLKIGDVNWTKVKPEGSEAEKDDDWYAFGKLKV